MNNGMTTGWIFLCCASHMWSCSTLLYCILLSALLIHLFCRLFPLPHSFFDLFILAQLCKWPKCFCVALTTSYDSALPVQATCRLPHRLGISVSQWLEFKLCPKSRKMQISVASWRSCGTFCRKVVLTVCVFCKIVSAFKKRIIISMKWVWSGDFIWCTG